MYWSLENVPWTNLHDLNLDWIVNTMKQTVEQWIAYRTEMDGKYADFTEQVNSDFDEFTAGINEWKTLIETEFSDLQTYVQNYFDNLDLNESTRYVINQMIASGEFIEVLNPSIVAATEAWLASHVTPTSPAVDNTLTISGAAADSKIVGDIFKTTMRYLGSINSSDPLSDKRETGYWLINTTNQPSDAPVTLDNLTYLYVWRAGNHAYQWLYIAHGVFYFRDILVSSDTVGAWHSLSEDVMMLRGTINSTDPLSNKRDTGYWLVNTANQPSDAPVTLDNLTYLYVWKAGNHAYQWLYLAHGRLFFRDIVISSSTVGEWHDDLDSNKIMMYRGQINSTDPLSDKRDTGYWLVNTANQPSDAPVTLDNLTYLYVWRAGNHAYQWLYIAHCVFYFRDILVNSDTVGAWHDELNFNTMLRFEGVIPANSNLNDMSDIGVFLYTGDATVLNMPTSDYSLVVNFNPSPRSYQMCFTLDGRLFLRRNDRGWRSYSNKYVSDSARRSSFVRAMNDKARQLTMTNSRFYTPSGIETQNYTTAGDMLKAAAYATAAGIAQYFAPKNRTIRINDAYTALAYNTAYDSFAPEYNVLWGKTGSWDSDQSPVGNGYRTLVCIARHVASGRLLAGVCLLCDSEAARFTAMKALFDETINQLDNGTHNEITGSSHYISALLQDGSQVYSIVLSKNNNVKTVPASITKIINWIVCNDSNFNLSQEYNVKSSTVKSGERLAANDRISIDNLMLAMAIESINTAANMLADIYGEGLSISYSGENYKPQYN